MVPANSRRIPRDPRYSGYRWDDKGFKYRAVTFFGGAFQLTSSHFCFSVARSYNPVSAVTDAVWAFPAGTKMFQFPALASAIADVMSST